MNSYDERQYTLMRNFIHEFEQGNLKIAKLIDNLSGLLDCLEQAEEEWRNAFKSEWWTLEQVYAVACYRGEKILTYESEALVYEAIDNMKSLLERV